MQLSPKKKSIPRKRVTFAICANVLVIAAVAAMCVLIYQYMLRYEEQNCWDQLEHAAVTADREMGLQLDGSINILKLMADEMAQEGRTHETSQDQQALLERINSFYHLTIFSRVDMLQKTGNIMLQTGELHKADFDFDALAEGGVHLSGRKTDVVTGKECVCCAAPIVQDGQTVAILLGVINCEDIPNLLTGTVYDGQSYACLVDRASGDIILDNWHSILGNFYRPITRIKLPGYENIDIIEQVAKGETGVFAYKDVKNGKASYLYYKPFVYPEWQLIVMAQEDVVFRSLNVMRRMMGYMICIVGAMLLAYLAWSVGTLSKATKRVEETQTHSHTDSLTGVNNQNSFTLALEQYEKAEHAGLGLLFLDLNGLKYANDHFGHDAGDRLLMQTARILTFVFGSAVYRIGGDEFITLAINLTEDQFIAMCKRAKKLMAEKEITAAMGVTWHTNSRYIRMQQKEADELMYADKQQYHKYNKKIERDESQQSEE